MPSYITWRRLQHVFSVTIFRLPRRHEDIFKMSSRPLGRKGIVTLKTSSRRLEDMSWRCFKDMSCLKTSWRNIFKTSSRCFGDNTSSRCLGDKQFLLRISVSNKSKCVSNKSIFHQSISDEPKTNPKCIN